MDITGFVTMQLPEKSGQGQNGPWRSVSYIIAEVGYTYNQSVVIDLLNDDIEKYALQPNELVTVTFAMNTREYNGRYFNSLRVRKIQRHAQQQPQQPQQPQQWQQPQQPAPAAPAAPSNQPNQTPPAYSVPPANPVNPPQPFDNAPLPF